MHSHYLRRLFLDNELAQRPLRGRRRPGQPDAMCARRSSVCRRPQDHVAPWRSVYKLHLLADADVTFVLANRGHNGGIVSEPGHEGPERTRSAARSQGTKYMPPDEWRETTPVAEGSWWPALVEWLGRALRRIARTLAGHGRARKRICAGRGCARHLRLSAIEPVQ